jgi:di/tricarboxylate transporter
VLLGPIALGMAAAPGASPKLLLIAVVHGAPVDFLTPIGHHNNMIVMGLAGYRFGDFLKAGWTVTIAVTATAILALWIWST